jgi:hypothetical protein
LATESGLGEAWARYDQAGDEYADRLVEEVCGDGDPPDADNPSPEMQAIRRKAEEAQKELEAMSGQEPIAELLCASVDDDDLDSGVCGRIGPRLRAIAENWEAASEGKMGDREKALEIADAMELVAQYPDLAFMICG